MLKRLIEVALPLKEVSEQSAREKSIRHGHISTLHIWWARRPLAACRAVVFASLIPDPDDPECPESFRKLVADLLGEGNKKAEFRPKNGDGSAIADTPRNRCLEFIKLLVRWENSNNPEYVEPARKLIAAAHKFLHPGAEGDAPKVLDPLSVQVEPDEPPKWLERFTVDPSIALGKLLVKGTRLRVEDLVDLVEQGRSDEELRGRHPELTAEDVDAVRHYAKAPEGLRKSFGGWAEDAEELDRYLEWTRQNRKLSRPEIGE